jgi:hypothetical protein
VVVVAEEAQGALVVGWVVLWPTWLAQRTSYPSRQCLRRVGRDVLQPQQRSQRKKPNQKPICLASHPPRSSVQTESLMRMAKPVPRSPSSDKSGQATSPGGKQRIRNLLLHLLQRQMALRRNSLRQKTTQRGRKSWKMQAY